MAQSLSSFFQLNLVSDLYPTLHKILMCEFATVLIVVAINADATLSHCLHIPTKIFQLNSLMWQDHGVWWPR